MSIFENIFKVQFFVIWMIPVFRILYLCAVCTLCMNSPQDLCFSLVSPNFFHLLLLTDLSVSCRVTQGKSVESRTKVFSPWGLLHKELLLHYFKNDYFKFSSN